MGLDMYLHKKNHLTEEQQATAQVLQKEGGMNEMWQAIDLLLDHYEKEYGTKPIGEMTEGSEEWYARVLYSLLTTLSIMHEEGDDAA